MTPDDEALIPRILDAFRAQTGKDAGLVIEAQGQTGTPPLPELAFKTAAALPPHIRRLEFTRNMDGPAVARLIRDWKPEEQKLILAPFIDTPHARKLKEAAIPFLDAAGNAFITLPGLFIYVTGYPKPADLELPKPARATRMLNATGLRVLFVLLARPEYINRPYRDIAAAAGVALGTVGWVMTDLKAQGYLLDLGKQGKHLRMLDRLQDEWVMAYIREIYPHRTIHRFRAENPDWWKTAALQEHNALWGSDVAGERLTGHLKPIEIVLYAPKIPGKLLHAERMRADPAGDVQLIDTFWHFAPTEAEKDIVPPLLAYADLLATRDPRAIEIAKLIHERYLAQPDRQD